MTETIELLSLRYISFADNEASGRSPLYEKLARSVAADNELLAFLSTFPPEKQQPNLFFAAVKYLFGTADDWPHFQVLVENHRDEIVSVMMERRTQTNEPARCTSLLPLLVQLPQPLALLEVGASAGLCLILDKYSYQYGPYSIPASTGGVYDGPVFQCRANAATPIPTCNVDIVWRAGLDISPIDLSSDDEMRWLEALVWPGEGERLENLRAAVRVARQAPPRVVRGDLRTDLPALAAEAPNDATLVICDTWVLSYVEQLEDRLAFARTVRELEATWISAESPGVFPDFLKDVDRPFPAQLSLLALNERPVAWIDPHGTSVFWFGSDSPAKA